MHKAGAGEREHRVAPGSCALTLFCSKARHANEHNYTVLENHKGLPWQVSQLADPYSHLLCPFPSAVIGRHTSHHKVVPHLWTEVGNFPFTLTLCASGPKDVLRYRNHTLWSQYKLCVSSNSHSEDSASRPLCHRRVRCTEMSIPLWPSGLLVLGLGGLNAPSLLLKALSMD